MSDEVLERVGRWLTAWENGTPLNQLPVRKDDLRALLALASSKEERVSEAMIEMEAEARRFSGFYPEGSDGRNTFIIFADKIAARAMCAAQVGG